ncbi:hypothetical protein CBP76_01215 [Companilactobacillus nuruki]|uniref:YfhO family protein n=1 Tax=Companilactobacillus nuruki TaxID=1993540 RepID=A0A2N7AX61_9LACO|nr:hypothetical protein CBP76_01215 [Companilactobacillus nuruki]
MSNHSWKKIILGFIFLLLSILYAVVFFQKVNFTQTTIFNIAHIKSLSNVFVSPINFDYWDHSGSLINLFSPWLTIMSGFLFVNFNVPIGFCVYLALITFLTLVSAYFYMEKFSKDTFESLLFAIIYAFSMNRFWLVFHEQRLENYLVLIFLPMFYYGVYIFFKNHSWKTLAWSFTLIIWTSPYMAIGVLLTLLPIGVLIIFSKISHHWKYWGSLSINSLKLIGLVLITTIGFIGPLIDIQFHHNIVQQPMKNFDFISWFNTFGFSTIQGYMLLAIGVLLSLLLIMIFLKSSFSYKVLMLEMIPLMAIIICRFQISEFDTSRLILAFQCILDLFVIILISRIIILVFQEGPGILKLFLMVLTIGGLGWLNYNQSNSIDSEQNFNISQKIDYSKTVVSYHDHAAIGKSKFLVDNKKADVSFYTKNNDYWIQYYNPKSVILDLPIQDYSGYKVQLNNETVKTTISKRGTLQLRTYSGKNIIEIHSRYNWIGIISLLINLFGFIILGYLSLKDLIGKNKKVPENS